MPFPAFVNRAKRQSVLLISSLIISVISVAQINLTHRLLRGYFLSNDAPTSKGKPTLIVCETSDEFNGIFKPATTSARRPDAINFAKETAIGIALSPTNTPPKLSVSKVFVQDSVLTIRYIRLADTTLTNNPQSFKTQPLLLLAIPKQTVLKTKLVENGKVVLTLKKSDDD